MDNFTNMLSTVPFSDTLKELFYDGMDRQTSMYLFGSAATGNWVSTRSDLDLLILLPEDKVGLLGEKINLWKATPSNPILDGFAIFFSGTEVMAKRLEEFSDAAQPVHRIIQLIDLWNIKNRSKHLWGQDFVIGLPDVPLHELSRWAVREMNNSVGHSRSLDVHDTPVVLSGLIWSTSWAARMLMLSRGHVCDSKREALQLLAREYAEIKDLVMLLLNDYQKSNNETPSITSEQSLILRRFCLELLYREIDSHKTSPL